MRLRVGVMVRVNQSHSSICVLVSCVPKSGSVAVKRRYVHMYKVL